MNARTANTGETDDSGVDGFQKASDPEGRLYLRGQVWWCSYYSPDGTRHRRTTRCRDRVAANEAALRFEREASGAPSEDEARWFSGRFDSFVYFIRAGESGPIKIGRAGAVGVRMSRMQTGSSEKLRLLCAIPGGARMERALHKAHAKDRLDGEWFTASDALLALVAELGGLYRTKEA